METTLCIIKPDAVKNGFEDKINEKIISSGLKIIQSKKTILTEEIASDFYKEHAQKPFFTELVEFIISGEVVVQILEGEDAITKNRELMGNTHPSKADAGTIRADFAQTIDANAVHGSDSEKSASREIAFFFSDL